MSKSVKARAIACISAAGVSQRLHAHAPKSLRIAFNVGLIIIEDCTQRRDPNLDW